MKKILKILFVPLVISMILLLILTFDDNNAYIALNEYDNSNYILNTEQVKKEYHKYGTLTSKGLILYKKENNEKITSGYEIEGDLNSVGKKKVIVNYNDEKLSYDIEVYDIIPGNIITLKDGSKWYYVDSDDEYTTLLSVYFLKEENGILKFLDENDLSKIKVSEAAGIGQSEINSYENIYKVKYNNIDSKNNSYKNSNAKKELDEKFTPNFLNNFQNVNISVDLPNAEKLTKIGGIFDWASSNITEEGQSGFEIKQNKNMLINKEITYWLDSMNTNENKLNRAWIINKNSKLWYATSDSEYALRPQIKVSNDDIESIILKKDNASDGELDLVTSPNYIIYDATENKIIKEKKSELSNGDIETIWPASMTKLITVLYSLEEMKEQNIDLDDKVSIEQEMLDRIKQKNPNASFAELPAGEVTYEDLIYGALFKSGLDATEQLSISLNGSEEDFVNEMNIFIKSILGEGAKTCFDNASGIRTETHITTLEEFAKLLSYALSNETFKKIINKKIYVTSYGEEFKSDSYDTLGSLNNFVFSKTGHSGYSGYNYAVFYHNKNKDYIVITATANSTSNRRLDNYLIYNWLFPDSSGEQLSFNSKIKIKEDKILSNIEETNKISDILKTNSKIELYDKSNNAISNNDSILKTGEKIKLSFPNITYDYNISVKGDTTGDGNVNIMDIIDIANHITKTKTLTGVYYISGDYDENNNINIMDIINLSNVVLSK